jgi:hypothetical protein
VTPHQGAAHHKDYKETKPDIHEHQDVGAKGEKHVLEKHLLRHSLPKCETMSHTMKSESKVRNKKETDAKTTKGNYG